VLVDVKFHNASQYHVVLDSNNHFNGKAFDVTMNQSDLKNNNNKFYIIQMLQPDSNPNEFIVWNRWGRVGYDGQSSISPFSSFDAAKLAFSRKYDDKCKGGYIPLVIDYSNNEDPKKKNDSPVKKEQKKQSNLHNDVQNLLNLIYDMKIMNKQMAEIGYDAKKMPLGKLGKETIKQGYLVLQKIENVLKKKEKGDLKDLSSQFYSLIPHDFGFTKMISHIIDDEEKLKKKVEMCQSLGEIEIATKIIEDNKEGNDLIDQYYQNLKCSIDPLDKNSNEFKTIDDFLKNTSAGQNVSIKDAFVLSREGENSRFNDLGNKMLLWHGSRITNFVGIMSQGLRIAPPEAPVSGYRFGKGCYFADMSGKSLCYCYPVNNTALILLCEVAMGKPHEIRNGDSSLTLSRLPSGTHSTKYLGQIGPPENSYVKLGDVSVPLGRPDTKNYWDFNEYIVYDISQVKLKYLLKLNY